MVASTAWYQRASVGATAMSEPASDSIRPLNILIVEDEALIAMDLELMLCDLGHSVVGIASTSAEALALAEETKPDLAMIDINFADGFTGISIAESIAEKGITQAVFTSANISRVPRSCNVAVGAIGKPYSHSGIRAALAYLNRGLIAPPPGMEPPSCLHLSDAFRERWAA